MFDWLGNCWTTLRGGAKPLDEPTPQSAAPTIAGHVSTLEPTRVSTRSVICIGSNARREIAKRHAVALVRHLIREMNARGQSDRALCYPQMIEQYLALCQSTNAAERPWSTVSSYVNRLIRQKGKPLKPYRDVVDPVTKQIVKARVFDIPLEMPSDWKERLEPSARSAAGYAVQPSRLAARRA